MSIYNLDQGSARVPVRFIACVVVATLIGGALVHWPLIHAPLDIIDFAEFIPILKRADSFLGGIRAVSEYFGGHGRFNLLTQAYIGGAWLLAGEDPMRWQAITWVTLAVFGGLVASLLYDLGVSRMGAGAVTMLCVVASSAASAWLRFTGEPLGAILFVVSLKAALRLRRETRRSNAVTLAVAWTLMVFAKETLVVLVPLGAAVALIPATSEYARARQRQSATRLTAYAILASAVLIWGAWARAQTLQHANSYVGTFGEAALTVERFIRAAVAIAVPSRIDVEPVYLSLIYPANWLFLGMILCGALYAIRARPPVPMPLALGLATATVVAGAMIYLPWPRFESFYALPFAVGPLVLFGLCVSVLASRGRITRIVTAMSLILLAAYAGGLSWSRSEQAAARRYVEHEASLVLKAAVGAKALVVVRAYPRQLDPDLAWQRTAASLERHSRGLLGRTSALTTMDVPCEQLEHVSDTPETVLVLYDRECRRSLPGTIRLKRAYSKLGLFDLRPKQDTFSVAIRVQSSVRRDEGEKVRR